MSNSLIISRFNEDLNWLKRFKNFKITIYNKGQDIQNITFGKVIKLENVGRESHTWIYHIFKNYENLDDINIFLQGRIDDLGCMAYQDPNLYINEIKKFGFAASRYGILGPSHWKWHVGIEKDYRYKDAWVNNQISRSKIGFRNFSKKFFSDIPYFVNTSYGGCFAVKKELILNYEKDFYYELLEILDKHQNPIEGHYMERLWCYMFIKNKFFYKSIFDVFRTKIQRSKLKNLFHRKYL